MSDRDRSLHRARVPFPPLQWPPAFGQSVPLPPGLAYTSVRISQEARCVSIPIPATWISCFALVADCPMCAFALSDGLEGLPIAPQAWRCVAGSRLRLRALPCSQL